MITKRTSADYDEALEYRKRLTADSQKHPLT